MIEVETHELRIHVVNKQYLKKDWCVCYLLFLNNALVYGPIRNGGSVYFFVKTTNENALSFFRKHQVYILFSFTFLSVIIVRFRNFTRYDTLFKELDSNFEDFANKPEQLFFE